MAWVDIWPFGEVPTNIRWTSQVRIGGLLGAHVPPLLRMEYTEWFRASVWALMAFISLGTEMHSN